MTYKDALDEMERYLKTVAPDAHSDPLFLKHKEAVELSIVLLQEAVKCDCDATV